MRNFSLAFLCGVVLLQQMTYLPSIKFIFLITLAGFFLIILRKIFLGAGILGFAWAVIFAHLQMHWQLPHELEGKNLIVKGTIASIPNYSNIGAGFLFQPESLKFEGKEYFPHGFIRLTWRTDNPNLKIGDEWQFTVHLKRIHSMRNPGGMDYEAVALQEGIRAQGYVITREANQWIASHWYRFFLDRIRQHIKQKIETNLPSTNTSPWITALVVGERQNISQENWQILRNTGTNHLMAIAGLHIGFMSSFAFAFVTWCWRRSKKLTVKLPSQIAGAIAALSTALIYSALAGFSLPTKRACIMLSVFLLIILLRRKSLAWHAWSIALLVVLLINPLDVLSESFWLSFGSVALIIYGVSGRLNPHGLWWKWGRMQWVIGFGLIPFSIWLFQQVSLVSFIANSIAIPCVGFLIVPLSLLGTAMLFISEKIGTIILILDDKLLNLLWLILSYLSNLSWSSWHLVMPNHWILFASCIGIIILLVPAGFPGRLFGIIGFAPLILYYPPTPKIGELWFTLLDVGQGLSAVVQTQNHLLVFDTGPKLSVSYDMGESVVVPFLHTLLAKNIDMLVISHGDNDHIGGSHAVILQFPVSEIKTSVPEKFTEKNVSYCLRGEEWTWDQVHFEFLYPTSETLGLDNDSSCVLKISAKNHSILLTGDIEKFAEKNLIQFEKDKLSSEILIAPHHGSKTSAKDDFIEAVHSKYVLYGVGYRNRYHFPNPTVVEKYQQINTMQFDTSTDGSIQFKPQISLYRKENVTYWQNT